MSQQDTSKASPQGWAALTFSPLENSLYRSIWIGGVVSNLGTVVQRIVAAWVMVTFAASPLLVTLVHTVAVIPMMAFALIAGAMADMYDKKRQMIVSLCFCALIAAVLWVLTIMEWLSPWSLLLCTFLLGTGQAFYLAAWQSSVYEIVSPEKLSSAISLNGLSFNFARSVGPAIGAELLAAVGAAMAFLANAVSFVVLIFALAGWKRSAPASHKEGGELPRELLGSAIWDGVRFVSMSPTVRRIIMRGCMFGFCGATLLCMPPLMVVELGMGPRALGSILTGFGIGAVAGALSGARLRATLGSERVVLFASLIVAAMLALCAVSQSVILTSAAMMIAGAGWVLGISTFQVSIQLSCPRWVAGRTISIFNMVYFFGLATGSAGWGGVTEIWGVPITLMVSCALFVVFIAVGRFLPIDEPALSELKPATGLPQPPLLDVDPRAGPIVVITEYRVQEGKRQEFLAAIAALKKVRLRDGARKWRLTQDLDEPSLWVERFHSPTWADYLHRLSRRLEGDLLIYRRIEATIDGKPVYHRRMETSVGKENLDEQGTAENLHNV